MNIGERIKQRRIALGLSVDEIAKQIGKNRATIYRYESSEIENLPTSVLEPLAKALPNSKNLCFTNRQKTAALSVLLQYLWAALFIFWRVNSVFDNILYFYLS